MTAKSMWSSVQSALGSIRDQQTKIALLKAFQVVAQEIDRLEKEVADLKKKQAS